VLFPGGCFFGNQQGTAVKCNGKHFEEIRDTMCVTDTTYKYLISGHRKVAKGSDLVFSSD